MVNANNDKALLVAEAGALKGKQFPVDAAGCKIGRVPEKNQIVLDDSEVSRFHASIEASSSGEFRLQDSSANGTFVNGQKIKTAVLHSGDRIRVGLNPANTLLF